MCAHEKCFHNYHLQFSFTKSPFLEKKLLRKIIHHTLLSPCRGTVNTQTDVLPSIPAILFRVIIIKTLLRPQLAIYVSFHCGWKIDANRFDDAALEVYSYTDTFNGK